MGSLSFAVGEGDHPDPYSELERKVETLTAENQSLQVNVDELTGKLKDYKDLSNYLAEMRGFLSKLTEALMEKKAENSLLKARLNDLQARNQLLEEQIKSLSELKTQRTTGCPTSIDMERNTRQMRSNRNRNSSAKKRLNSVPESSPPPTKTDGPRSRLLSK